MFYAKFSWKAYILYIVPDKYIHLLVLLADISLLQMYQYWSTCSQYALIIRQHPAKYLGIVTSVQNWSTIHTEKVYFHSSSKILYICHHISDWWNLPSKNRSQKSRSGLALIRVSSCLLWGWNNSFICPTANNLRYLLTDGTDKHGRPLLNK